MSEVPKVSTVGQRQVSELRVMRREGEKNSGSELALFIDVLVGVSNLELGEFRVVGTNELKKFVVDPERRREVNFR